MELAKVEMLTAEIISVGTELLLGDTVDTNAAFLGQFLAKLGIACTQRQTVGDNLNRATEAIRLAKSRADIVITIGGLGPTEDDLTRHAVAAAFESELIVDEEVLVTIKKLFSDRGAPWIESNSRQAERPPFCVPLSNPHGTATGLFGKSDNKWVVCLPGPPSELVPMANGPLRNELQHLSGQIIHSRVLRVAGMGESAVEDRIKDLLASNQPTVAPYAKTFEVHLRLTASAPTVEEASSLLDPMEQRIRERLGQHVYSIDDQSLESVILAHLIDRKETLSVAESLTGGGLGQRLTSVPGASQAFLGGLILYTPQTKSNLLGIDPARLEQFGAVSEEIAYDLAEAARRKLGSTYALSLTGNAGPTVDSGPYPVGTVFIGLSSPSGTQVIQGNFGKSREAVRLRSAQTALFALWKHFHAQRG